MELFLQRLDLFVHFTLTLLEISKLELVLGLGSDNLLLECCIALAHFKLCQLFLFLEQLNLLVSLVKFRSYLSLFFF